MGLKQPIWTFKNKNLIMFCKQVFFLPTKKTSNFPWLYMNKIAHGIIRDQLGIISGTCHE